MEVITITRLSEEYLEGAYETEHECLAEGWSRDSIKNFIGRQDAVYLAALENSNACGIAGMYIVCGEGQIMNIAVKKEYRRRGIGSMLLKSLLEEGKKIGTDIFTLEVSADNVSALKLYENFGFREVGRRRNYYKDADAVLMTLKTISY